MSEKRITQWLKGAVYRKHATTVSLSRLKSGRTKSEHLQMFWIADQDSDDGFSERELAEDIFAVAAETALVMGGRQHRYQLQADTEEETNVSSMSFAVVNLNEETAPDFEQGRDALVPQLMRHNELLMRTTVGSFQAQMRTMLSTLEALSERLGSSEDRAAEATAQLHETHDAKLLLAAETRKVEAEAANSEALQGAFIKWLPTFATHLMRKSGADVTAGMPPALTDVLRSLKPDQMMALTEILEPEQSAAIGEMYLAIRDADDAAAKKGQSNGKTKEEQN